MKPLLLICGPTACHKSETALRIAERWGGEILSIDSVAVYRGMDIGSAKPDAAERQRVPHHLIDIAEPDDASFSVAAFQQAADEVLTELAHRNVQPILVGGSGLYCDAVLENMGYAPDVAMYLDSSKLRMLGWSAKVDMAEAYRRLITYLKEA